MIPDNVHLIGDEAENTILDADADSVNQAAVIIINEVENVYVASMTLTGGYTEGHGCAGGGALLVSASDMSNLSWDDQRISMATLENLIIENSHSHNGGGISFYRVAGPSLTDVVVSDNTSSFQGGGIFIYVSDVTMNSVTVENNTCLGITFQGMDNFGHGGGVFLNQSTGQFSNLSILNNNASSMGGGIWSSYGSGWTIENSSISGNMAPWNGGGIALWDNNSQGEESSPTIKIGIGTPIDMTQQEPESASPKKMDIHTTVCSKCIGTTVLLILFALCTDTMFARLAKKILIILNGERKRLLIPTLSG